MTLAGEEHAGQILSQDVLGRVLVTRERRESLLEEYDRSGMSGVSFAKYVGIKYTTLAYWLKRRRHHREREKLLMKAEVGTESGRSSGTWIEAVVDKNGSPARAPEVLQLCSHAVIGWLDAPSGLFGLRSIQMASI